MNETSTGTQDQPILGIGQIMTDVLTVFFRCLHKVLLLALPAAGGMAAVLYGTFAMEDFWLSVFGVTGFSAGRAMAILGIGAVGIALGTGAGLSAGPLTAIHNSYALRREVPLRRVGPALLARPIPAVLCGTVVMLLTLAPLMVVVWASSTLGSFVILMLLIAVGMYAMGRWGMSLPAVSMDRMGLRALGRSSQLSKGYRLSIAGTCFLFWVTALLIGGATSAGLALAVGATMEFLVDVDLATGVEEVLIFADALLGLTLTTSLLVLGLAAVRARLVEIKEPPDFADMVDVFD